MRDDLMTLLPEWPPVPRRLWLTAGLGALALANLAFLDEIWPHAPGAQHVIIQIMLAAVLAGSCQLVSLLHGGVLNWWARLLFRMVVMPAVVGCVLVAIIASICIVVLICINI